MISPLGTLEIKRSILPLEELQLVRQPSIRGPTWDQPSQIRKLVTSVSALPNKPLEEDISLRFAIVILVFVLPKAIPPFPTILSAHYSLVTVFVFVTPWASLHVSLVHSHWSRAS